MNIVDWLLKRKLLSLEELQKMKLLAEQVVLAVEQTAVLPDDEKKRLALEVLGDLIKENGLDPPADLAGNYAGSGCAHCKRAGPAFSQAQSH